MREKEPGFEPVIIDFIVYYLRVQNLMKFTKITNTSLNNKLIL